MGAQGIAVVDFGAFPGSREASVTVIGQAAIVAASLVEAWVRLEATADHSADEHRVEPIRVLAGDITPGTGFVIYAFSSNPLREPLEDLGVTPRRIQRASTTAGQNTELKSTPTTRSVGGQPTRLHGLWTMAWVWN